MDVQAGVGEEEEANKTVHSSKFIEKTKKGKTKKAKVQSLTFVCEVAWIVEVTVACMTVLYKLGNAFHFSHL